MKLSRLSRILPVVLLSVVSCAPELSTEVRKREGTDREYDRLSKAAGTYQGYLTLSDTQTSPLSVQVIVTKNPTATGDEKPILSVTLRTGLLGGITIVSTSATYDWGTKDLVAAFARPGTSSGVQRSLEIRGNIQDGKWTKGLLLGARLGQRPINVEKIPKDLFDSSPERFFDLYWDAPSSLRGAPSPVGLQRGFGTGCGDEETLTEKPPESYGVLTIKKRPAAVDAPATSDLPYLPGFEVAINFEPFAHTPQTAKKVYYDPLTGMLDIQFTDASWVRMTGLYLSAATGEEPKVIPGTVTLGGHLVGSFHMQPRQEDAPQASALASSSYYIGYYQGSPTSLAYKAIVYLDYQGSSVSTQPDLPFPNFPQLHLEVDKCNGDAVFSKREFKLDVLDYLKRTALFRTEPNDTQPLEIHFNKDWSYLDGIYLGSQEGSGQDRPRVRVRPNPAVAQKGCAAAQPAGEDFGSP